MALTALILYLAWLTVAFAAKSAAMKRATGSTGFHGISKDEGPVQRLAGAMIVVGAVGALASPILDLTGLIEPFGLLDASWIGWVGFAAALTGAGLSLVAQREMGQAWRIGVEPGERTELVT
jgi:protein-S-isoprenylcysteine O-methyltransferase Ste14